MASASTLDGGAAQSEPSDASLEGRVLGEFVVGKRLGEGGFGVIHLAEQTRLGRTAVVKMLRARPGADSLGRQRFLREALLASRLDHPYAAHVYDGGAEPDGLVWIAMELVRGLPLREVLAKEGPMPLAQFVPLCERICEVVQSAHDQKIIHRDLKPANVMVLERAGQLLPKLVDFGLAKVQGEVVAELPFEQEANLREGERGLDSITSVWMTGRGATVGSPGYMAPEQWRDAASVDARTDLYALGVLCYEALTGHRPFAGANREELSRAHRELPVPSVGEGLPRALDDFFSKALAKSPADRFSSAVELARALREASGLSAPRRIPVALRRAATATAVIVGIALLALGARELWRWSLPFGERRVAIRAVDLSGADGWLAPIIESMASRRLGWHEQRLRVASGIEQANVMVQVGYRRAGDRIEFDPAVGRIAGRLRESAAIDAASVSAAVDVLIARLSEELASGRPEIAATASETAALQQTGARSLAELRHYRALVVESASTEADDGAMEKEVAALSAGDPSWARPYALLSLVQGTISEGADATIKRARSAIDRARDPLGADLVDGIALVRSGEPAAAEKKIAPVYAADPDDVVSGWYLYMTHERQAQVDLGEDLIRRLHGRHPELQFGSGLVGTLNSSGHLEEARAVAEAWVRAAPDNESAQSTLMGLEVREGQFAEAEARARRLLWVLGASADRSSNLTDVLILGGKLDQARQLAQRSLQGSGHERSNASYRLGIIDVLEGRFAAAYAAYLSAFEAVRSEGMHGNPQSLGALSLLAPLVAPADSARWALALASVWNARGAHAIAAAVPEKVALRSARAGHCPDVSAGLASLPEGQDRDGARIDVLRAAGVAGCATCGEIVRAGREANESSSDSILDFAICAAREQQWQLARDALRATRPLGLYPMEANPMLTSAFVSVLGRFHLAGVLAASGDRAGARSEYESFLAAWGHADRPIPEVDAARTALAALQ